MEWISECGRNWGRIHGDVQWQSVGAKLVVTPTVVGEGPLINIKLTPEVSGYVDGKPQTISFVEAATEVVAMDGQPLPLGRFGENKEFYSRFLIGVDSSGNESSLDITLVPHIIAPSEK